MADDNPRPTKRVKREPSLPDVPPLSSQSTLTPPPSSQSSSSSSALRPLPREILLLSLPSLLTLPPNHRNYVQSLQLSLQALRQCLMLPALSPEVECRAWCGLAEIGMKIISGGLSVDERHSWAHSSESEVDEALGKAIIIAQKHPALRNLKIHLTILQAQFSGWQHKIKFARTQLRNLISTLKPTDLPHLVYSAHLAAISLCTSQKPHLDAVHEASSAVRPSSGTSRMQDIQAALSAIQDMEGYSVQHGHSRIKLLAQVLRLRTLVAADMWQDVGSAIEKAEQSLGLSYDPAMTPKPKQAAVSSGKDDSTFIFFESPLEAAMAVHALMMAVIYYTHAGSAAEAAPRLSHLHALLDTDILNKFPDGTVEVAFPEGPPLVVQVTHPRLLYQLGFLVSCVAKRDAVGRKPKRKIFANEGLSAWEREKDQGIPIPAWASAADINEIEQRLASVKGDLLCELVAVSIMRSEFDIAEQNLDTLVAHTRSYGIFSNFSARIALHHAHLAHALSQTSRALACYQVAARLAGHDDFVRLSGQAGEAILRLGLESGKENDAEIATDGFLIDRKEAMGIAKACRSMGGALEAVGQVIEALLAPEILRSKEHLKRSLELATKAQDNHLRAGVLALVAAHYVHTAGDHAYKMLLTCEQLAVGLGAPAVKDSTVASGHARLGLWVGQKLLELYKRAGKEERVQKQIVANHRFEEAVRLLTVRSGVGGKATDG